MLLKDTLSHQFIGALEIIRNYPKDLLTEIGITYGNFITLIFIAENEGSTQAQLAQINKKDRNVIGRHSDVLEQKNYVERKRGIVDRRSYTLFLTDKGKEFILNNENIIIKSEQHALKNLTNDEISTLYKLMNKITSDA